MSIIARLPGNLGSKINAILRLFFLVAVTMGNRPAGMGRTKGEQ